MNNSPAELVRNALVTAGVFVHPGAAGVPSPPVWPVYVGHMPETPDNAACVYDTPGFSEGRIHRTGQTQHKPGFQVRIRALDHATAYAKASAVQAALDLVRNSLIAIDRQVYTIVAITQIGGVMALGQEQEARRRNGFTLNGTITYREVPQ